MCFTGFRRSGSLDIFVLSFEIHEVRKPFLSEISWVDFLHDFLGGRSVLLYLVNIYKL